MPQVVYQDRWFVIASKPSGIPTQATRSGSEGLYEQLQQEHAYVGLHHRLDQPTSGLVLFTLRRDVNKAVTEALRSHAIQRSYQALLSGSAASATWTWDVTGKSASTRVEVAGTGRGCSAVWCHLDTGRKHQIRVQAAMAGTPVLGDRRYGEASWDRLALHAARLRWVHPITNAPLDIRAPLPEPMASLWRQLVL